MIRAAPAQPFFGRPRARDGKPRLDRPALQRYHHGIDFRQLELIGGYADGLHRAQAAAGQRIGEIGSAGVVVGDAAECKRHGFAPT